MAVRAGGCTLQLRQVRAQQYIPAILVSSNKGWQRRWFYLRNDDGRLPSFSQRVVTPPAATGAGGPRTRNRKSSSLFWRPCRGYEMGVSPSRGLSLLPIAGGCFLWRSGGCRFRR
jgi:hypothetical protein